MRSTKSAYKNMPKEKRKSSNILNKLLFEKSEKRRYIAYVLDGTIRLLNARKDEYLYPLMVRCVWIASIARCHSYH